MEAGKRAAEARARLAKARVQVLDVPVEHQEVLGSIQKLELRTPTRRQAQDAFEASSSGDTLAIALSAMVWLPAEANQPAEQLWPTPADVDAVNEEAAKGMTWLYVQALDFLKRAKADSPKG